MNEHPLMLIENPHGDYAAVARIREMVIAKQRETIAAIEANTAAITAENYKAERLNAFDADAKLFADAGRALCRKVEQETGIDGILVQIGASSKAVKLAVDARTAKIRQLKSENEPPPPSHTYFYAVTATDAQHLRLQKEIAKTDGGFGVVSPQNDAEWRTAAKLFGTKEAK